MPVSLKNSTKGSFINNPQSTVSIARLHTAPPHTYNTAALCVGLLSAPFFVVVSVTRNTWKQMALSTCQSVKTESKQPPNHRDSSTGTKMVVFSHFRPQMR